MQKNCCPWPIEVICDVFGEKSSLADVLRRVVGCDDPRILLIADANLVQRCEGLGARIGRYMQSTGLKLLSTPIVVMGGEKLKSDEGENAQKLIRAIIEARLESTDCVVALGGGTLLDCVGYAAAQVRGGVKFVRMPTSPAAMFEGPFATYAAIDLQTVKDALRVPSAPIATIVDPLLALPVLDAVWSAGLAEAVRGALVDDAALLKKIDKLLPKFLARDPDTVVDIVESTIASRRKKGISTFGMWSAFRLQAMSAYKLPHGYAVPIGMCIDAGYAVQKGCFSQKDHDFVMNILKQSTVMDGLQHSQHLVTHGESVLFGLDAWRLSQGAEEIVLPAGLGKNCVEALPDRALMSEVIKSLVAIPKTK